MNEPLPVGILGGTFDPIHNAHLHLAEAAHAALGLDHVLLIPAGNPRHRASPVADPEQRLAMVRLAAAGQPWLRIDEEEVRSAAPSYTVPTLQRLRQEYGAKRALVLLLGSDAFYGLASWHRWQELFELAHIAVATRPGSALDPAVLPAALREAYRARLHEEPRGLAAAPGGWILPFAMAPMEVSSTAIRAAFGRGKTPGDLLPPAVIDYIARHRLYQSPA